MSETAINWDAMRFWLEALLVAATTGAYVFAWWRTRDRNTAATIADARNASISAVNRVEKRVNEHSDRILLAEQRINSLPNDEQFGQLHKRIDELNRELGEVSATLASTNALLRLHQEYLMRKEA